MKIVFFGSLNFAPLVLPTLEKNFKIEQTIEEKNFNPETINDLQSEVAVLAAFGKILPKEILDHFKYGILNIHPSLLPKYRGPTPVQTVILNGDSQTGVTIMKLDEKMDHGPILAQEEIEIMPNDTAETLYEKLFPLGAKLVVDNLEDYVSGKKTLAEQDHNQATYTKPLTRDDGYIDILITIEIERFERMVRAFYPWPGTWTSALLNENQDGKIIKFLPNKMIQVEGKNPMSYKDFLNGYPNADKKLLELLA